MRCATAQPFPKPGPARRAGAAGRSIMTILASAFALAPLALALGEGSQLQQPLAIAVIGGFVLSGFLVLWVLPALYCALDPRGRLNCEQYRARAPRARGAPGRG